MVYNQIQLPEFVHFLQNQVLPVLDDHYERYKMPEPQPMQCLRDDESGTPIW